MRKSLYFLENNFAIVQRFSYISSCVCVDSIFLSAHLILFGRSSCYQALSRIFLSRRYREFYRDHSFVVHVSAILRSFVV